MTFDVYVHWEIDGIAIEWDDSATLSPEVRDAAGIPVDADGWRIGRLAADWYGPRVGGPILFRRGALVVFDGYEVYQVERRDA